MLKAKKSTVGNASVNKVFNCLEVFLRYREWDGREITYEPIKVSGGMSLKLPFPSQMYQLRRRGAHVGDRLGTSARDSSE